MSFAAKVTTTNSALLMKKRIRTVYLAGKVAGTSWRDQIVKYGDGDWSGMNHGILPNAVSQEGEWQIVPGVLPAGDGASLAVTGPYWMPLASGPECGCCGGHCSSGRCSGGFHLLGRSDEDRRHGGLIENNLPQIRSNVDRAIDASDLVFAWIDTLDSFGTLYEIGRASALNKLIVAAIPPNFAWRELWLSLASADRLIFSSCPGDAWRSLWSPSSPNPLHTTIQGA